MKVNSRRIADFIMGGCAGFCFFYGQFLGTAIGSLMLFTFIILNYREAMLKKLDESIAKDEAEEKEDKK